MPERFHLVLLIHAHQPCGNFGHVLEKAYKDSYLPFIELLEKHPGVHMGLHYSGPLLTWIEEHRPEYFARLKALVSAGQVELIGGGFYKPSSFPSPRRTSANRSRASLLTSINILVIGPPAPGSPSAFGNRNFPPR